MAEYIEREAFIADKRWLYCTDCDRRKGKKKGKYVTLYEIGEAPCKSCWANDMLEEIEAYPAADVVPVVRCAECKHWAESQTSAEYGSCDCDALLRWRDFYCASGAKMEESE